MAFQKGQNPHHPKKGSSTKADPIRDTALIARIKRHLLATGQYRNYGLFTLGINTGLRANELLSLRIYHVKYLKAGEILDLKQRKTDEYRMVLVNNPVIEALDIWLSHHPQQRGDKSFLFPSLRYGMLGVPALCNLVKRWCVENGGHGKFSSHSLRKTWGYHQRINGAPLVMISRAYGHKSEAQTLRYIGIMADEVRSLYMSVEL